MPDAFAVTAVARSIPGVGRINDRVCPAIGRVPFIKSESRIPKMTRCKISISTCCALIQRP